MNCSQCNTKITCSSNTSCWCTALPKLQSIDQEASCMCKDCLIKALAKQYNSKESISEDDRKYIAKLGEPNKPIDGVDFQINAQGLYTFTSWYLLRCGYCCENGCQNCPF